jgi:hypothetical protein
MPGAESSASSMACIQYPIPRHIERRADLQYPNKRYIKGVYLYILGYQSVPFRKDALRSLLVGVWRCLCRGGHAHKAS